jgi:hypothetical protein
LFVCFFGESNIEPRPPEPLQSTEVPYDTGAIPQINDEFVLENCVCLIDMATPHLHGINALRKISRRSSFFNATVTETIACTWLPVSDVTVGVQTT